MLCFLALAFVILLGIVYTYLLHKAAVALMERRKLKGEGRQSSRGMLFGAITGALFFGILGGVAGGLPFAILGAILGGVLGGALGMVAFERIARCWEAIFDVSSVKQQANIPIAAVVI